jgi:hypothetical protein
VKNQVLNRNFEPLTILMFYNVLNLAKDEPKTPKQKSDHHHEKMEGILYLKKHGGGIVLARIKILVADLDPFYLRIQTERVGSGLRRGEDHHFFSSK